MASNDNRSERGVTLCNEIVSRFCKLLIEGNSVQKSAEEYFTQQAEKLHERITLLDAISENIAEEKRCLKLQLEECENQVEHTRRRKELIIGKSDELSRCLSADLSHIENDEAMLSRQHETVDERIKEIRSLMSTLHERFSALSDDAARLRERESALSAEERRLELAKSEAEKFCHDSAERKTELLEQEGNISTWVHALDTRESEANLMQTQFLQRLKDIEADEKALALNPQSLSTIKGNQGIVTKRALMDDYGMSIEREEEKEEIEKD